MKEPPALSFDQFMILHRVLLAYPEGLPILSFDMDVGALLDFGFIRLVGVRYFPTEAGVNHVMPRRAA